MIKGTSPSTTRPSCGRAVACLGVTICACTPGRRRGEHRQAAGVVQPCPADVGEVKLFGTSNVVSSNELNLIYHIIYMLYKCAMIFVSYHVQVAKFHEVPHNSSSFSERPLGCCCLVSRNLEMEFKQQKKTTRATNGQRL